MSSKAADDQPLWPWPRTGGGTTRPGGGERAGGPVLPGEGGERVKLRKPGQEKRADMPTIGPLTLSNAHAAGLRGIAFEAGNTLLTDRQACEAEAERLGMFLLAIDPEACLPPTQ